MKNFAYIILIYFFSLLKSDAQVNNKQWIFGYRDDLENKFGLTCLDFNNHEINLYPYLYQNEILHIGIGSTFVCDTSGQIALISDNCSIYDNQLKVITGGDQMHTNQFSQGYCTPEDKFFGLLSTNILFPNHLDNSKYYHLYKDIDVVVEEGGAASFNYMLNIIKKDLNGQFQVLRHDTISKQKSQTINTTPPLYINIEKRWIFHNIDNHTNSYNFFSLDESTDQIDTIVTQNIGHLLDIQKLQAMPGLFSPDKKTYSTVITGIGLQVLDFDQESLLFSNPRDIYFPVFLSERNSLGLCYSPDSRFVYVSTLGGLDSLSNTNYIYQIDLILNTCELLATFFAPDEIGWPIGIGSINQGPDCRLYISPAATTHWLHVIHHPNRKGSECKFQPVAIDLPTRIYKMFPLSLNVGMECDSTYNWPFELSNHEAKENTISVSTYPNPCSDVLFLQVSDIIPQGWTIQLYDLQGKLVKKAQTLYAPNSEIDIKGIEQGVYIYLIKDKNKNFVANGKILKI